MDRIFVCSCGLLSSCISLINILSAKTKSIEMVNRDFEETDNEDDSKADDSKADYCKADDSKASKDGKNSSCFKLQNKKKKKTANT